MVELREVWASTPEGARVLLTGSEDLWCCTELEATYREGAWPLPIDGNVVMDGKDTVCLGNIPCAAWQDTSVDELQQIIHKRYPDLAKLVLRKRSNGQPVSMTSLSLRGTTFLTTPNPPLRRDGLDLVSRVGNGTYRDFSAEMWLVPTLGEQTRPLKPVISWWAVLYALSMLARYQPSEWTRMLDVDTSPDAPALEFVLDEAHQVCINLLAHIFEELRLRYQHGVP